MTRILRSFFDESSPRVARKVLGKTLVRVIGGRRLSGIIVEAEAYRGSRDPASHAFRGKTDRNAVMFGKPGRAYVYLSYGVHQCLNLTCEPRGTPAAVLVRALEPLEGIEEMRKNRESTVFRDLTSGPGKLTQALRITADFNGEDLVTSDRLFLETGKGGVSVETSPRIGITTAIERRWRFFVRGNECVSRVRPHLTQNP